MTKKIPQDKLLEKTKLRLMMTPGTMFFTTILFSLKYIWDTTLPTAAVDGRRMFVNPDFFEKLSSKERIGVLLHEVLHVALNHITRKGDRDHKIFNMAGDYIINNLLVEKGFSLPSGCLINKDYSDMNTEQVYNELFKKQKKGKLTIDLGPIGADILSPKTPAENSAVEQEIADIVLRAATQTKQANSGYGNIPGEVLIELDKVINPKLPWNIIFQNFMSNFAKDDYSYRRPNKKYLPDLYMPSPYSEAICNIAEAVDSSGSVHTSEFSFFIRETGVIQETLKPDKITLIDFDTKINAVHEVTQSTDIMKDIKFTGRGGTNIRPVLKWARENYPEVLIIFTDGDFSQPSADEYPSCPIVWLIHNNPDFVCSYGEIIHYEL